MHTRRPSGASVLTEVSKESQPFSTIFSKIYVTVIVIYDLRTYLSFLLSLLQCEGYTKHPLPTAARNV
jgi:hypothetical protein